MYKIRDRKLSSITQLSKTLFSGIIAAMLSTIVMAGGDQLSADPSFKLIKKESGGKITAIATYDNGRSAFCGDSDGNIYCVSNGGYWKVVNAKASIDSIIIGNALTGDFCFTASGKAFAYTLKENKIIDISGNLPGKIERLYRDGGSKEIYAVADAETDDVYALSDDGSLKWESVANETAKKILANISARMDSDKGANSNDVSSYGKNFKGMQNGQIYVSSSYDRKDMTVKVEYVSSAVSRAANIMNNVIYRVTIEGCRLNTEDIFTYGYNGFKYTLSCDDTKYNKNAYPVTGVIYESDGKDGATLQNRAISFLWLGPSNETGEHTLSVNEVAYNFSKGEESIINSVTIDLPASELPLNYANYYVTVRTEEDGEAIITESNGTCAMPFNVVIRSHEGGEVLSAEDKDYESPNENPYNHLVFYLVENKETKANGLIGCDLYSPESESIAILPADKVEVDGLGGGDNYIKYGVIGKNCKLSRGKTFYAYLKKANEAHEVSAGLVFKDDLTGRSCADFKIIGKTERVAISPEYNVSINNPDGRDFTFSGELFGSNWQGNQFGYGGYLDYQLIKCDENESYNGIFVYLPEGLNERITTKRQDIRGSKLKIGYYFDPRRTDDDNPLLASKYHINDTPSYCNKMRKKMLYAMLFDQYGRPALYNILDTNGAKDPIGGKNLWDIRDEGKWCPSLNMLWEVGNLYNTPIIMGCPKSDPDYNKKVKYGITDRGLFVPPITTPANSPDYESVNASFMSDISVWLHGKDNLYNNNIGKFKIAGYNFATSPDNKSKPAELFFNTLEIDNIDAFGKGHKTSISLNVSDKEFKELPRYPQPILGGTVHSINRIQIFFKGYSVSNWLDRWSVISINPQVGVCYANSYDFYYTAHTYYSFPKDGNYVVEQCYGEVDDHPAMSGWYKVKILRGNAYSEPGWVIHRPEIAWPVSKFISP